jgi:predicted dehydrogenase
MSESSGFTRRDFMKVAGATAAFATAAGRAHAQGDKVRVACIGVGNQGAFHIRNGLTPASNIQIVAVCDVLKFRLKAAHGFLGGDEKGVKAYVNYKEMIETEKPDAVIIATPLHTHFQIVMDCLDAGINVFCEKTLCADIGECRQIVQKVHDTGLVFQIGHQRRYHPRFNKTLWLIRDQGMLGRIVHITANWHRNSDWRFAVPKDYQLDEEEKQYIPVDLEHHINWRVYKEYSGGLMTELAAHHLDVANWILCGVPKRVTALGGIDYWRDGRTVADNCVAGFEYEVDPGSPAFKAVIRRSELQSLARINRSYAVRVMYSSITSNAKRGASILIQGDEGSALLTEYGDCTLFGEKDFSSKPKKEKSAEDAADDTMSGATYIPDEAYEEGYPIEVFNDTALDQLQMESFANDVMNKAVPKANAFVALQSAVATMAGVDALNKGGTVETDLAALEFDFELPDPYRYEYWEGPEAQGQEEGQEAGA